MHHVSNQASYVAFSYNPNLHNTILEFFILAYIYVKTEEAAFLNGFSWNWAKMLLLVKTGLILSPFDPNEFRHYRGGGVPAIIQLSASKRIDLLKGQPFSCENGLGKKKQMLTVF